MNRDLTNRYGGKLNSNAIYQIIHRLKDNNVLSDYEPDWAEFSTNRSEHERFSRLVNCLDFQRSNIGSMNQGITKWGVKTLDGEPNQITSEGDKLVAK